MHIPLRSSPERVAITYRVLFAYPFVRPQSEQNCSLLTRVYIRVRRNTALSDGDALLPS
jgi:hypothetical protein